MISSLAVGEIDWSHLLPHGPNMETGSQLGHYLIESKLGQGGMGVVYKAIDVKLERPVALKVLPPDLMRDEERRTRFTQEARAASAVTHPAIAQIYGIEEGAEGSFIVMEFVDGSTVRQLIAKDELDVASAVEIGIHVASALGRAHESGIVHRDIKSDNIMVTQDGHPKVLDFGLAKLMQPGELSGDPEEMATMAMTMTRAGAVMGTVAYMSPEQARGLAADARSDIFSFGIVLYEMASGKLPFHGQSALDTMHSIAFDKSAPISDIRSGLPYSLQKIIDQCMEKDPDLRPQSMTEVEEQLRGVKRELDSGITSTPPILERLPKLEGIDLTSKGLVYVVVWTSILLGLILIILLEEGSIAGTIPFLIFGALAFAYFRGRRNRVIGKFVKKARKEKAVRLIATEGDKLVVLTDPAPARTLVKLNALRVSANSALYSGKPFDLDVREGVSIEEERRYMTSSGLRWSREEK